ncbi:unnamed protein product [Fraxinus pennsylvanica]|uniref:EF-hand domain-containing protein n=1 Tax=Fraxinus pennsylvanica TaxID=56036 RepID=A0AAD1ZEN2_9LAMI|nr:unnamed protein product [Fraxinus pennsylvanica]
MERKAMETAGGAAAAAQSNRRLGGRNISSSSFRLRSPSLNKVRLRRIFDIFDKNNDGMITLDELGQALGLLGLNMDLAELEIMIQLHVQPGNSGLTYKDFEDLHVSLNNAFFGLEEGVDEEAQDESDLSEAFKVFDEDGDGYISARELQVVLGKLGLQEGGEIDKVEQMISSVDSNHDGRVDFFEFKNMMRCVTVPSS